MRTVIYSFLVCLHHGIHITWQPKRHPYYDVTHQFLFCECVSDESSVPTAPPRKRFTAQSATFIAILIEYTLGMAPIWSSWLAALATPQLVGRQGNVSAASPAYAADYLAEQWRNPDDILSVLLLTGPDVVKNAIAQLAGRFLTPVAFSFGWMAYAPATLLSSFGGAKSTLPFNCLEYLYSLMPLACCLTLRAYGQMGG